MLPLRRQLVDVAALSSYFPNYSSIAGLSSAEPCGCGTGAVLDTHTTVLV